MKTTEELLEIKDLFHLSELQEPTCGRHDCDCNENPEHWVGVHAGPVLLALIDAAREAKKFLQPDLVEPGRTVFWKLVDALKPFADTEGKEVQS